MKKLCAIATICSLVFLAAPVYAQVPDRPLRPGPTAGSPVVSVAPAPVCPSPMTGARAERAEAPQRGVAAKLGPYIGIGGSYAFEDFDDIRVDGTTVSLDDTWGLNARIGYQATPAAAFELEYVHLPDFEDTLLELDVRTLMLVAKLFPPLQFPVKPFLAGGIGWMDSSADVTGGTPATEIDDSDIAAKVGIGVDFYPRPDVSIGLEADYVFGLDTLDDLQYTNVMLGIAYHW